MSRALKVYGWVSITPSSASYRTNGRQSRFIVAAHSVAEVLRVAGISRSTYSWNGSETGNAHEVATAMASPLTVFHAPLDNTYHGEARWESLETKGQGA